MSARGGRRGPWPLALGLLAAAVGCHQAGRSIVRVQITAGAGVSEASLERAMVTVTQGNATIRDAQFPWAAGGVLGGVYLPAEISGAVEVSAAGFATTASCPVARSDRKSVSVTPGQNTEVVMLPLLPVADCADGGAMGGAGGGSADSGSDVAGSGGRGSGGGGAGGSGVGGAGLGGRGTGGIVVVIDNIGGRGSGGSPVDAGTDVAVTGPSPSWQPAGLAETNLDEQDLRPQVVADASGNALVVYEHGSVIWFNRYSVSSGAWGTAGPLSGNPGGQSLHLAIDGNGVATVIWEALSSSPTKGIWVSSSSGSTWSTPVPLSSGNAFDSRIAISPATSGASVGAAIAVWTENNGMNQFVLYGSSRPNAGGAWTPKAVLKPATDAGDRNPSVAMDGAGNGFVIWEQADQADNGEASVWISRFSAAAFSTATTIETFAGGFGADSAHIALNASGAGVASWRQVNVATDDLYTRFYVGGVWGAPQLIVTSSVIPFYQVPHVAIDPAGNSTAVWGQVIANNTIQARLSRHGAGQTAWDPPTMLEADNRLTGFAGSDVSPELGLDAAGNVTVIWRKQAASGLVDLWAARVTAAGVVGTPVLIDGQNTNSVFGHQLAVAPNGVAVAVWYYANVFDIWSAVFR